MDIHTAMEESYKNGYAKGLEDGKPKWVPVDEGFPIAHSGCIVWRKNNFGSHCSMVCYSPALGFHYYDSEWGDITLDDVTHWMPLPEPPKEVKHG